MAWQGEAKQDKETNMKHRFEPSADTRLIYSLLMKAEMGDVVTYTELSEQVGRKVTGADSYLQSALRMIERDENMVFSSVRGVGYKRLTDAEIATQVGESGVRKIKRTARRTAKTISKADDSNLSNEERVKRNTFASFMGAVAHMAKPRQLERLETGVRAHADQLAIGKTLDALKE